MGPPVKVSPGPVGALTGGLSFTELSPAGRQFRQVNRTGTQVKGVRAVGGGGEQQELSVLVIVTFISLIGVTG